jgi:hypothetical protein
VDILNVVKVDYILLFEVNRKLRDGRAHVNYGKLEYKMCCLRRTVVAGSGEVSAFVKTNLAIGANLSILLQVFDTEGDSVRSLGEVLKREGNVGKEVKMVGGFNSGRCRQTLKMYLTA